MSALWQVPVPRMLRNQGGGIVRVLPFPTSRVRGPRSSFLDEKRDQPRLGFCSKHPNIALSKRQLVAFAAKFAAPHRVLHLNPTLQAIDYEKVPFPVQGSQLRERAVHEFYVLFPECLVLGWEHGARCGG